MARRHDGCPRERAIAAMTDEPPVTPVRHLGHDPVPTGVRLSGNMTSWRSPVGQTEMEGFQAGATR